MDNSTALPGSLPLIRLPARVYRFSPQPTVHPNSKVHEWVVDRQDRPPIRVFYAGKLKPLRPVLSEGIGQAFLICRTCCGPSSTYASRYRWSSGNLWQATCARKSAGKGRCCSPTLCIFLQQCFLQSQSSAFQLSNYCSCLGFCGEACSGVLSQSLFTSFRSGP